MSFTFPAAPLHDAVVFEPELVIDITSGHARARVDGQLDTQGFTGKATVGYLVWLGVWMLAVGTGVGERQRDAVATGIRASLGAPELPIVFVDGLDAKNTLVANAAPSLTAPRELARAAAYLLVQGSAFDEPTVTVKLNGSPITLTIAMVAAADRTFFPSIH